MLVGRRVIVFYVVNLHLFLAHPRLQAACVRLASLPHALQDDARGHGHPPGPCLPQVEVEAERRGTTWPNFLAGRTSGLFGLTPG